MRGYFLPKYIYIYINEIALVPCSTLESRNPTWAVSAPDSQHPLGAKRLSIYPFDPRWRSRFLSSLWLSVSYGASEGRTSLDFAGSTEVPFFFLLPSQPSKSFLLRSLYLSFSLTPFCSHTPVEGSSRGPSFRERRQEGERKRVEVERREKSKRRERGGAWGLERTRSPFTLLSRLGRYLSTTRSRTLRSLTGVTHRTNVCASV